MTTVIQGFCTTKRDMVPCRNFHGASEFDLRIALERLIFFFRYPNVNNWSPF